MVEQHRGRHNPWHEKGYTKEERESYHSRGKKETRQEEAEDRSKMEGANSS